ncbi:phage terminase small subunit [Oceanobacillus kimchii]|uniref:phage terminase small subunit n=1 Tax=Oceanobacillus kimchii TaxID=746691 RepID=UPI00034B5D32|nr:phage terminase small subunit [Oceanobacillus kimchii]
MKWDNIKKEWETSKITLKDLAAKYEIKLGTLKSRKSREGWSREATKKDATKSKKVATKKKIGGQPGNKGNPNPTPKFAKRNSSAVTHGLFAKYLPDETMEIVNGMNDVSPLEILWMNIQMQFASIMRAQQIMFVQDKYEITKEVKKTETSDGENFTTEKNEWEIQFAWDKQANFLNSQSRAMGELRSMLKQFYELAEHDDKRLLEVERMQTAIDKTKKETEFIEERTKLLKGQKKDTGLLDALIEGRKRYEQAKD